MSTKKKQLVQEARKKRAAEKSSSSYVAEKKETKDTSANTKKTSTSTAKNSDSGLIPGLSMVQSSAMAAPSEVIQTGRTSTIASAPKQGSTRKIEQVAPQRAYTPTTQDTATTIPGLNPNLGPIVKMTVPVTPVDNSAKKYAENEATIDYYESIPEYNAFQRLFDQNKPTLGYDLTNSAKNKGDKRKSYDEKQQLLPEYKKALSENYGSALSKAGVTDDELKTAFDYAYAEDAVIKWWNNLPEYVRGNYNIENEINNRQATAQKKITDAGINLDRARSYYKIKDEEETKQAQLEEGKEDKAYAFGASVAMKPATTVLGALEMLGQYATGKPIDTSEAFQYSNNLRSGATSDMNPVAGFLYNAGASTADILASLAMGGGSVGSALLQGGAQFVDTAKGAAERGLTPDQIMLEGVGSGVATAATEALPLEALGKAVTGKAGNAIKGLVTAGLSEGAQEGAEDIVNTVIDAFVAGEKADVAQQYQQRVNNGESKLNAFLNTASDYTKTVALDSLAGMLSGLFLGAGASAVGSAAGNYGTSVQIDPNEVLPGLTRGYESEPVVQSTDNVVQNAQQQTEAAAQAIEQLAQQIPVDKNGNMGYVEGTENGTKGGPVYGSNEEISRRNDGTGSETVRGGLGEGSAAQSESNPGVSERGMELSQNSEIARRQLETEPYIADEEARSQMKAAGSSYVDFKVADNNPALYADSLLAAKKSQKKHGGAVTLRSADEIQEIVNNGGKTFLASDGTAGGIVEADGNLTGVFKNKALNKTPYMGSAVALMAVKNGSTKGDCYGMDLVNMYSAAGFEPVARVNYTFDIPGNEEMDAEVREMLESGEITTPPDVYALKLRDGYSFDDILREYSTAKEYSDKALDALPLFDDYDEMLAYRDRLIEAGKQQPEETVPGPGAEMGAEENPSGPRVMPMEIERELPDGTMELEFEPASDRIEPVPGVTDEDTEPEPPVGKKKVSKFRTNKPDSLFMEEDAKYFPEKNFEYETVSEQESVEKAREYYETYGEDGIDDLIRRTREAHVTKEPTDILQPYEIDALMLAYNDLYQYARETGDPNAFDRANKILRAVRKNATHGAQTIQVLKKWKRNTVDGQIAGAQKKVRDVVEESNGEKAVEDAENMVDEIVDAADETVKEIEQEKDKEEIKDYVSRLYRITTHEQDAKARREMIKKLTSESYVADQTLKNTLKDLYPENWKTVYNAIMEGSTSMMQKFNEKYEQANGIRVWYPGELETDVIPSTKSGLVAGEAELADRKLQSVLQKYFPESENEDGQHKWKQIYNEILNDKTGLRDSIIDILTKYGGVNEEIGFLLKDNSELWNGVRDLMDEATREQKDYKKRVLIARAGKRIENAAPRTLNFEAVKGGIRQHLYTSMLGNFRTLIPRNAGGNVFLGVAEQLRQPIAAGIDAAVSKKTGVRTQNGWNAKKQTAYVKGLLKGITEELNDIANSAKEYASGSNTGLHTGKTGDYDLSAAIARNRSAYFPVGKKGYISKALNMVNDLVKHGLSAPDRTFYEGSNAQTKVAMNQLVEKGFKLAGFNDRDSKASRKDLQDFIDLSADFDGLESVYQGNTMLSDGFTEFNNALRKWSKGMIGFDPVTLAQQPFIRTPANVMDMTIQYNPVLGGLRNLFISLSEVKGDGVNQKRVVNEASRQIVGMGVLAACIAAAKAGIITGGYSDDDDEKAKQKAEGFQPYSLHIGDNYYDIGYIPVLGQMAEGAAAGVEAWNKAGEEGKGPLGKFGSATGRFAGQSVQSVMDQSLFTGISDLFSTGYGDTSMAENIFNTVANSYAGQVVPSLGRQVAATMDPYQRELGKYGTPEYMLNYMKQGIPGLRETLPIKYGNNGEPLEQNAGDTMLEKIYDNMIRGGKHTNEQTSELGEALASLADVAGDKSVYLPTAKRSDLKTLGLEENAENYALYKRLYGGHNAELAEAFVKSDSYDDLPDNQKVSAITNMYKFSNALTKAELTGNVDFDNLTEEEQEALLENDIETYDILDADTFKKAYQVYDDKGAEGVSTFYTAKELVKQSADKLDVGTANTQAQIDALNNMNLDDTDKGYYLSKIKADISDNAEAVKSELGDDSGYYYWYSVMADAQKATGNSSPGKTAINEAIEKSNFPKEVKDALTSVNGEIEKDVKTENVRDEKGDAAADTFTSIKETVSSIAKTTDRNSSNTSVQLEALDRKNGISDEEKGYYLIQFKGYKEDGETPDVSKKALAAREEFADPENNISGDAGIYYWYSVYTKAQKDTGDSTPTKEDLASAIDSCGYSDEIKEALRKANNTKTR